MSTSAEVRPALPAANLPGPGPAPAVPQLQWYERLNVMNVSLLVFLLLAILSLPALRGSGRDISILDNLARKARDFFPPDFSILQDVLQALLQTIQISILATLFAVVLAFPLALAGARTMSPRWLVLITRLLMNCIRTIPALILAVLAVSIVGPNPLAGVIALTIYSLGYLGKFFSEAFESVDTRVWEGLRGLGASTIQAFQHGLWPHAKPLIWSYSLWMLEYNIRSASIIGFVGAGGIGLLLFTYQEYGQWQRFSAVLLVLLVVVTALDLLGEWIRKRLTGGHVARPS